MSRDETPKRSVTASADRTSSAPSGSHSRSGGSELPTIAPSSLRILRLSVRPGRPERTVSGPEVSDPGPSLRHGGVECRGTMPRNAEGLPLAAREVLGQEHHLSGVWVETMAPELERHLGDRAIALGLRLAESPFDVSEIESAVHACPPGLTIPAS